MNSAFLFPKPLSVMLIDDDDIDSFTNSQLLISGGICSQVAHCSSARVALEKLQRLESAPVLILLDLSMPQVNGLDFLFHYEQLPPEKTANTSIILLTGYASYKPYLVNKALQYPHVIGCIEKPLHTEELTGVLNLNRQAAV